MPATKTKNRTERIENLNPRTIGLLVLFIIGAAIILVAPLVHIGFPTKTSEQIRLQSSLDQKLTDLKAKQAHLRNQYDNGVINSDSFIEYNDILEVQLEQQRLWNADTISRHVDRGRIFGWKTPRKFLIALGVRLPYLILAILISFLVSLINTSNEWLSKTFIAMQIGIYGSAFYQLVWVFWTSQDYPLEAYRLFILGACLLTGVLATFAFRYLRTSGISSIKAKIRYIMSLMIDRALENGHIKNEDRYEEEIIYPALDKLDER